MTHSIGEMLLKRDFPRRLNAISGAMFQRFQKEAAKADATHRRSI
jgi:hypothetical protein